MEGSEGEGREREGREGKGREGCCYRFNREKYMLVTRKEWEQSWTKCGEADLIKGRAQGSYVFHRSFLVQFV